MIPAAPKPWATRDRVSASSESDRAQASEAMIKHLYKAAEFITSNPTAFVQQAGIVALRDGEPYVRELRAQYAQRRAQVPAVLRALPGITLAEPQGAFYAFPRIDGLSDSTSLTADLLRTTGLALAPGVAFGEGGEGSVRICYAAERRILEPALERLDAFLRGR